MAQHSLRRITPYLRPYKRHLAVMLFGALGAQIIGAAMPLTIQHIIDNGLATKDHSVLYRWSLVLALLGLLEPSLLYLRRFVLAKASSTMEMKLRDDLYAHLQRLSLAFHGRWQSGQLLSRAIADANVIFREFVSFAIIYFVSNTVTMILVATLLVRMSPSLALVASGTIPLVALASRWFETHYLSASRRLQDQNGHVADYVEEAALGIQAITTFGRSKEVDDEYRLRARDTRDAAFHANELRARYTASLGLMPNLTLAAVLCVGAIAVADDQLTVGTLVAFLSLLVMLVWPIESLGEIMSITHRASAGADRIFEILDTPPDIADRAGARNIADIKGRVRLHDVTFSYTGSERDLVLAGIDLDIEPGETLALVGRTGSGKSTLCSLVGRLQDVTGGSVTIDGHDVRDVRLSSLRGHVGMVFEDPLLFSASVRENLVLGHHHASDDDLRSALELSQATFVYDLPWGLDTRIGEQGLTLSGGQRQRLALARAVIGRPKVLVLDDPLSALDVHTEALIESTLKQMLDDTTAITTAHRPSTVALADRVALLDQGAIVAIGSHQQLLKSHGGYRTLMSRSDDGVIA